MRHIASTETTSSLTNIQADDIQPNAVDLRIAKVLKILPNTFKISEVSKTHRGTVAIEPDDSDWWFLPIGSYEIVMENVIEVGPDEAGWVITRSTLNRNGVFITSGLYDSKYYGPMSAVMHVTTGPIEIQKGTRVGQYLLFKAEALHAYSGSYGFDSTGTLKKTDPASFTTKI